MNNVDDRIRAALHAAVDGLREQDLRPEQPPVGTRQERHAVRWAAPLLTAAAVAAAVVTTVLLTGSPNASKAPQHQPGGESNPPSQTTSAPPPHSTTVAAEPATGLMSSDEPLWPFATAAEAAQWQDVDGPAGHSPWHSSAKDTALFFVTGYLQFGDITEVTSVDVNGLRADVGVGYDMPNEGGVHTASVIHLARFGDENAPWEVVGASGTDITIDSPDYGSDVSTPLTVQGHISGVDESIVVAVRSLDGAVDVSDPVPGGGDNTTWLTGVTYGDRQHGTLTIVASTGGHLTDHERFAVIGVSAG